MSTSEFADALYELGFSPLSLSLLPQPATLADSLLNTSKRLARLLQQHSPALKRTAALEVVAKSTGFQHWHELNTYAKGLIEDFGNRPDPIRIDEALPRLARMGRALPLILTVFESLPPKPEHQSKLETLADALSHHGIDRSVALQCLARLQGEPSWRALLERRPIDSARPLYAFAPADEPDDFARFVCSPACRELVEQQDALYEDYEDRPASDRRQLEVWIRQTLAKRPDFLEGYLALGTVLESRDETYREAGPVYAEAITRAEALIPKGFKGEVIWGYVDNRFYHRLLYAHMCWCSWSGQYPTAVSLARKQLRRNKSDNMGIRFLLPSLLVAAGRLDEAAAFAERRLRKNADRDTRHLLALSIGRVAVGDLPAANRDLLEALFAWPPLRLIVTEARGTSAQWQDTRFVSPDAEQCHFAYHIASASLPIKRLFNEWLADPAVIAAETALRKLFGRVRAQSHPQRREELWKQWCAAISEKALELS